MWMDLKSCDLPIWNALPLSVRQVISEVNLVIDACKGQKMLQLRSFITMAK